VADLGAAGWVVHAVPCDIAEEDQVEAAFARSVELVGGRIDSVFANAGYSAPNTPFVDLTLDRWRSVLSVNLDGTFLTLRAAARHMIDHRRGGSLVIVSSTSAIHGAAMNEAYAVSKAGLLSLTRALAVELARYRIRVNALVPGWTLTELSSHASDALREATTKRTPVRRWADPDEMGPVAVFLADPAITFHTGDTVVVDGGYTVF